ncbi:hypothetical protein [Microbacterium sp. PMB16]|uniref:hypothetical protein n=1 Tax=Microbacterium sp. PMB16 TaxID=3120157 RepID=UPI003F4BF6C3
MTGDTHVVQSNGYSRGPLIDTVRPYSDQLRFSLSRMNGTSFWAYSLWRAAEGSDLLEDIPLSDAYIQSAGSAEAMTVEARVLHDDGTAHHFTVGKPGAGSEEAPSEVIRWDDGRHSTTVYPNEVFTADEAAEVFYAYFLTDEVPEWCTLRELDLRGTM